MFFNDEFYREKLIELTRDPLSIEGRAWIGAALVAQGDPRGVKLLTEHFERCLKLGEPLSALWAALAIKRHAPLHNIETLLQRFVDDQAERDPSDVASVVAPMSDAAPANESESTESVNLEEVSGLITALSGEELINQAHAVALDWSVFDEGSEGAQAPEEHASGLTPLLSSFNAMILTQIINKLTVKTLTPGELMIEEGEEADGVYWLCAGQVEVTRRNQSKETVTLAQLNAGALIGEMGLITKSPRIATVTALTPVQAVLLPAKAYELLDAYTETVHLTLSHLVGRRMLENLTKFSPVFKAIPPEAHPTLLSQFKAKVVPAGEILLRQGKAGRGLYLILDGLVQVTQLGSIDAKWLREGDMFGEISLVYESPVSATCTAARRSLLYMLKPDQFQEMIARYPEIKDTLAELSLFRNLDELYTIT